MPERSAAHQRTYSLTDVAPVDDIGALLQLRPSELKGADSSTLEGDSHWMPTGRVFGGQLIGQSIVAATTTVPSDRSINSLHAYFLRSGDMRAPAQYAVETLRDGGSFSQRRVIARQGGRDLLTLTCSFQTNDPGIEHSERVPAGIPDAEELPPVREALAGAPEEVIAYWDHYRAFEMRFFPDPIAVQVSEASATAPFRATWLRPRTPIDGDARLHAAALAYASDYTLFEPILAKHRIPWSFPGLLTASLDHAIWFHRTVDMNDWMLYVQDSPVASGARGLSSGRMFTRTGDLVATVIQQGMVRRPQDWPERASHQHV